MLCLLMELFFTGNMVGQQLQQRIGTMEYGLQNVQNKSRGRFKES